MMQRPGIVRLRAGILQALRSYSKTPRLPRASRAPPSDEDALLPLVRRRCRAMCHTADCSQPAHPDTTAPAEPPARLVRAGRARGAPQRRQVGAVQPPRAPQGRAGARRPPPAAPPPHSPAHPAAPGGHAKAAAVPAHAPLTPSLPPEPRATTATTIQRPQVYDTPGSHVTRDYKEGTGQLGDLRFRVADTSGLEPFAAAGSLQARAAALTLGVLRRADAALVLFDAE